MKNNHLKGFTVLLLAFLIIFSAGSCKNDDKTADDKTEIDVEEKAPENKYTLSPFTTSEQFPEAALSFESYQDAMFDFKVEGDNYQLGQQTPDAPQKMCANSAKGQHIHLIMGTDPYLAKYTSEFEHEMEDGTYEMLAFISRSYHESIKTESSYVAQSINIKDKAITSSEDITKEMIFYSRPKGTYTGKANTDKVMLDFFLVNSELSENRMVHAEINGEKHIISQWQPFYIEGLPMGKNSITLSLVDKDGNAVDVPGNPVTREFTLAPDPADEM